MGKLIALSLIALLSSCSQCPGYEEPEYIKMADRITNATVKRIQKEKGLNLIGSGGGMIENVKEVFLHFVDNKPHTIEQARELAVQITDMLLYAFNSNEEIRPYLSNYPFDVSNFYLIISFEKKGKNLENSIANISINQKIISYCDYDPEKQKLIAISEETYEEAIQKIRSSNYTLDLSDRNYLK